MMIQKFIQATRISLLSVAAMFVIGGTTAGVAVAAPLPQTVAATNFKSDACAGLSQVGGSCAAKGSSLDNLFRTIVQILSLLAGVAAVIMIIISGFRYITSGGDPQKVAGAKNALIYALVGLVIAALAQVIVHYVLGKVH
jgi:hypothetical protein